jgi:putative nucleotidyltransferase with HDIG domain
LDLRRPKAFLSSRVARRIFFLFVLCALLPFTVLTVISFHQVSDQLRSQSLEQLARASEAQGMDIFERLAMLDAQMQLVSLQIKEHQKPDWGPNPTEHFLSMTLFGSDGRPHSLLGNSLPFSDNAAIENQHLLSDQAAISLHSCSNESGTCILMMRSADLGAGAAGLLIGELNPEYLWDPQRLPAGPSMCVLSAKAVLFCSDPEARFPIGTLPKKTQGYPRLFQWNQGQTQYDAAYWTLPLKSRFFTDPWAIELSQKRSDALVPMQHFRNSFAMAVLLALWFVTLLTSIQIRRTLVPLERLQEGTRQIAAEHFDARVEVQSGDEFEALAASFNSMADQLGKQFHALKTIADIDQAIFGSLSREEIADAVLAHLPYLLRCDCFAIAVFGDAGASTWIRLRNELTGETRTLTTNPSSDADRLLLQNKPVLETSKENGTPGFLLPLREMGMGAFLVFRIVVDGAIFAALVCAHREELQVAEGSKQHARQVADQLAVALSNVELIEALEQLHWGTLSALARAIDAKSAWTAGHSERVTNLALKIGRAMGLSKKDLQIMHRGGLLHDIGKIGTPPEVLDKPGALDAQELKVMRDHVRIGVRILEPIPGFREALPIVAQHHEWFDGSGYPEGLAGENISLYARVFAVADCYDALTSDRPYRKGLSPRETVAMLVRRSGTQFDPKVIEVFQRLCKEEEERSHSAELARGVGSGV